jgi:hypothetical protein
MYNAKGHNRRGAHSTVRSRLGDRTNKTLALACAVEVRVVNRLIKLYYQNQLVHNSNHETCR